MGNPSFITYFWSRIYLISFWILALWSLQGIVYGQTSPKTVKGGGFGYFTIGGCGILNPQLEKFLQKPRLLTSNYTLSPNGIQAGGGGFGLLGRWMLGGYGLYSGFPEITKDSITSQVSLGSGMFTIGYLSKVKERMFLYPYLGVGGSGITIKISNEAIENTVEFDSRNPLKPQEKSDYSIGGIAFDLGGSLQYFLIPPSSEGGHGGMLLGLQAGCGGTFISGTRWKDSQGRTVKGPEGIFHLSPYVRLTIGGGGFSWR